MDEASTRRGETLGIAQLVIVEGMWQRHHDGGAANHTQFGNG